VTTPQESDEFNAPVLGPQWQWQANYDEKFGMMTAFGTMRIYTYKLPAETSQTSNLKSQTPVNLWLVPNMLLQKTPADEFTVTTKLRFTSKADGQMGGLIMMGLDYSALVVRRTGKMFELVQMTCKDADKGKAQTEQIIATLKPTAEDKTDYKPGLHEDIYLRLTVSNAEAGQPHGGKPMVQFAWSSDGKKFSDCGDPFAMRQGKWIGAKFGFVSVETDAKADRGWLEADWMRVGKQR
jgi:beta-xylosidase